MLRLSAVLAGVRLKQAVREGPPQRRWRVRDGRGSWWDVQASTERTARLTIGKYLTVRRKDYSEALVEWAASNLTASELG